MKKILAATVGLLTVLLLYVVGLAVPIGTHTGSNPSVDSIIFNTYTFATLPTTSTWPFLAQAGSAGTKITCRDCNSGAPPTLGIVHSPPSDCTWTGSVWACNAAGPNGVIDPLAFGCHNDYNPGQGLSGAQVTITTTNGSGSMVASAPAWTVNDVGKVFRVENTGGGVPNTVFNTLNATITTFTDSTHITVSPVYPGAGVSPGEAGDSAEWGTADDACLANIRTAIGDTTQTRALNVFQNIPIIFTQPIVWQNVTGQWQCNGMGQTARDNTHPQGGFIWFGTTPDQDGITVQDSWGFHFLDCFVVGATSAPLRSGIRLYNPVAGTHPNGFNTVDHDAVGGFPGINQGPVDQGNGAVINGISSDVAGSDTTFTVSNPANGLSLLGPGEAVLIRDLVAGDEVVWTAPTYVRGANPVTLVRGFNKAHTVANTSPMWAIAPVNTAFMFEYTNSTQNDRNDLNRVSARNVGVGILVGEPDVLSHIKQPNINSALVGIIDAGGLIQVDQPQWDGVCWTRVMANLADYVELGPATQHSANQDSCGPALGVGYASPVTGIDIELLMNGNGITFNGTPGGRVKIIGGGFAYGANVQPNGTIIDLGSGQGVNVDIDHVRIVSTTPAVAPTGLSPAAQVFPIGAFPFTFKSSTTTAGRGTSLVAIDPGFANNAFLRTWELTHLPSQTGDYAYSIRRVLRGTETFTSTTNTPNFLGEYGRKYVQGEIDTVAIDAPTSVGPCVCATAGATSYKYKAAWGVNGHLTAAGGESTVNNCAATVDSTNTITCNISAPGRGADTLYYYRTAAGGGAGTELLAGSVFFGASPSNSFTETEFVDSTPDGSLSGAVPTTDSTGGVFIGGATLELSNNGHLNLLKGTGTAPTASTGTMNTISSDASFEVSGATVFPLTVTLNTTCPNQVWAQCIDETSAVPFKVTHTANTVVLTGNTNNDTIQCNTSCK